MNNDKILFGLIAVAAIWMFTSNADKQRKADSDDRKREQQSGIIHDLTGAVSAVAGAAGAILPGILSMVGGGLDSVTDTADEVA